MRKLASYEAKRDFARTPEPAPASAAGTAKRPRFVVQEHRASSMHWDLRLEHEGTLASWAVPKGLPRLPGQLRLAIRTEDHPIAYLDFHGTIPEGEYGAGEMTIWDRGTFDVEEFEGSKVKVALHGDRVEGRYHLFRTGGNQWLVRRLDPPADPRRKAMPERLVPMLAKPGPLPEGEGWAFEIKWDGVRALAYAEGGRLRLESRNLLDITDRYPELRDLGRAMGSTEAIFDGEIVALDEKGRASFSRLQQRIGRSGAEAKRLARDVPIVYEIFDVLFLDGKLLLEEPYLRRREILRGLDLDGPHWRSPGHHVGDGHAFLEAARREGLEGVVAKRTDSRYEPGTRSGAWVKVKAKRRQELVIAGWTRGEGARRATLGSVLLGYYDEAGKLHYAGKAGTGFDERTLGELFGRLTRLERADSPFDAGLPPKGARFAEPDLVAEFEFTEWTHGGTLRHPVFKGLREDKTAQEVRKEEN